MNLNEQLPDPDKYRDTNGKRHWGPYLITVAICAAGALLVAKWHEELLLASIELFHFGHSSVKVVRVENKRGQADRNIFISIDGRIYKAKGPHEFHIDLKDIGKTAAVYQAEPEEVLTSFIVNLEDFQIVIIPDRNVQFVDDTGAPVPDAKALVGGHAIGQSDAQGRLAVRHCYCNQEIEVCCPKCGRTIGRETVTHQQEVQKIVVSRALLRFTRRFVREGEGVQFRDPDGTIQSRPINQHLHIPDAWLGKTIDLLVPGQSRGPEVVLGNDTLVNLDALQNQSSPNDANQVKPVAEAPRNFRAD